MQIKPPIQLLKELPLSQERQDFIAASRTEIGQILSGQEKRRLLIVGPCSIHDIASTIEYGRKLRSICDTLAPYFFPIMRVYFEKPRTILGWKGLVSDPHLDGSFDISTGIQVTRQLLLSLTEMQLPLAAEFLDPSSVNYFGDLISWGCIGARTVESQIHRQMASALHMPVAFKNSTSGNVDVAIHGIVAAASPHTFIGSNKEGLLSIQRSLGNHMGHLVLRGGEEKTNYDPESIQEALGALRRAQLPERLLIDCAHDNSKRKQELQILAFQSLIEQIVEGNSFIRGILLESHLNEGCQELPQNKAGLKYAVSLTDPCLNWETTAALLRWACQRLSGFASETTASKVPHPCSTCA